MVGSIMVTVVWDMRILYTVYRYQCFVEPAAFICRTEDIADYEMGCDAI
jgi:hypothetical protein